MIYLLRIKCLEYMRGGLDVSKKEKAGHKV